MTHTMQMIKKYWAYLVLAFSITFFIYKRIEKANSFFSLKLIETKLGWGYEIYSKDKVYIRQENIPAIQGNKGFVNKEDAEKIGNFVIQQMIATHKDLPVITLKQIDSLHIKY